MKETKEYENYQEFSSRDKYVGFLCFIAAGLFGYLLIHFVVLRGA